MNDNFRRRPYLTFHIDHQVSCSYELVLLRLVVPVSTVRFDVTGLSPQKEWPAHFSMIMSGLVAAIMRQVTCGT